jgi:hypothetical protein
MTLSSDDWVARFAVELGIAPPSSEEIGAILALASAAAHASDRTAAPVSCWMAASAAMTPTQGRDVAESLATRLQAEGLAAEP